MVDVPASTTPFDAVDDLIDAGFDEPRAKAVVRLVEGRRSDLATKADLDAVAATLRAEVRADLSSAVNRMMVAQAVLAGVILAGVAAIVALFQLPT